MRRTILAGIAAAVLSVPVAADERALGTATIGGLVLWFDAWTWRVERDGDGYAIHALDAGPRNTPISIAVGSGERPCSPEAVGDIARIFYEKAWTHHAATIPRNGFDLHVATLDMGCRNLTGSPVFACTAYQGHDYFFTANPGGCRNTPPDYDGPVVDLLMGLAVR